MKLFLDETACRQQLRPFTYTRHVADIRIGIFTIREKWAIAYWV
ncbi:MAG: putative sugar nucleotidyl transferase [Ferruginibacter sp.]